MYLFIGDKKEIAVEFKFEKVLNEGVYHGFGKIWFGENFLGSMEDAIYFDSYLLGQIESIMKCRKIEIEKVPTTIQAKFEFFQKIELDKQSHLSYNISTTTFTDMNKIFAYNVNDVITILWKVNFEDTFDDVKTQGINIFSYQFELKKLTQIFKILDNLQKIDGLAP